MPGESPFFDASSTIGLPDGKTHAKKGALVTASTILWAAVIAMLAGVFGEYTLYAVQGLRTPFGLDYSEGLLWQQALWLFGPHSYGDIFHYPFVVFEYPPIYLLAVRLAGWSGLDMLLAGRLVSLLATLASAALLAWVTWQGCRPCCSGIAAALGAFVASLLPITLLPILSWSILMRVDMLALAFTWAGIALAIAAFHRRALLYPAVVAFVAAVFTKQIYIAAPLCVGIVWLMRSPRLALRAYAAGGVLGLLGVAILAWRTGGGFLRHVFLYNVDRLDLIDAARQTALWLAAYPVLAILVPVSCVTLWRQTLATHPIYRPRQLLTLIRTDTRTGVLAFLTLYTLVTTLMLAAAGKTGSSRNYFIEWMAIWCAWIGLLAATGTDARTATHWPRAARLLLPACLILQLLPIPSSIASLRHDQFSAVHRDAADALLARVRSLPGKLLSDDMVMVIQSGREVGLEPGILLELARGGLWDESKLVGMLDRREFAAVVTAYDPGDPTFDARYLPATQRAMLRAYPHVERFGDYRLRLPDR